MTLDSGLLFWITLYIGLRVAIFNSRAVACCCYLPSLGHLSCVVRVLACFQSMAKVGLIIMMATVIFNTISLLYFYILQNLSCTTTLLRNTERVELYNLI